MTSNNGTPLLYINFKILCLLYENDETKNISKFRSPVSITILLGKILLANNHRVTWELNV